MSFFELYTTGREFKSLTEQAIFLKFFRKELFFDDLVKSQKSRRSLGGGSQELIDLTGFPLSRE